MINKYLPVNMTIHSALNPMQMSHAMRRERSPYHDLLIMLQSPLHTARIITLIMQSPNTKFSRESKAKWRLIGPHNLSPILNRPIKLVVAPCKSLSSVPFADERFLSCPVGYEASNSRDCTVNSSNRDSVGTFVQPEFGLQSSGSEKPVRLDRSAHCSLSLKT